MKSVCKKMGRLFLAFFCGGLAWAAQAGGLTNNFTSGADFVTNGVVGTMWDGVYLGFGGVPGGNNGGDGNGATLTANSWLIPGALAVQSTATSWAGSGDDGFYLWKIVAGDFDVSVEMYAPYENPAYHFAGLLARAYTTNGPDWGRPFGANGTNAENWVNITRFNEFNIGDQVRYASNANDVQISAPYNSGSTNYNTETNTTRFFRINRTGDTFTMYDKTNASDAWVLEQTVSRPDLHGIPMQVGIEDAAFSSAQPTTYWTDFELNGTNVTTGVVPPANPSNLTTNAPNPATGGITLTWTPGAGSSGSIVVVRANSPVLTQVPNNGYVYTGNAQYGTGDQLANGINVIYVGTGNTVNLTGLGGPNVLYNAAVFSYTGSGASTVYSTDPARVSFLGTASVTNVEIYPLSTNIPAAGGTPATAYADFSTGSRLDITYDPSAIWSATDTSIAVATNGAVTGVSAGNTMVSVSYAGFTGYLPITVHAGTSFSDDFSTYHDYVSNGVPGSPWDGVYLGSTPGGYSGGNVPLCVANIGAGPLVSDLMTSNAATVGTVQSNNVLTVQSDNTAWSGAQDNGFLLYKWVKGDFQVAVHITDYTVLGFHFTGLMARPANVDGTPYGTNGSPEGWIYWDRFDEFGISTLRRNDVNASDQQSFNTDGETSDFWLLMSRVDDTNFYFFKKATATGPWEYQPSLTIVRPDLAGVPMQVGLDDATYTPTPLQQVQFDNFMLLDATNLTGFGTPPAPVTNPTNVANADGTITLSWTPSTNGLGSLVVMSVGPITSQPLNGVAYTGNSVFGMGDEVGNGAYVVYVGTGDTVTVSGLIPGTTYCAAVYAYSGSNLSPVYNLTGTIDTCSTAEGVVAYVEMLPGGTSMPNGGILPFTAYAIYTNGAVQDVSDLAAISSSPSNYIIGTNGVLTALTNGAVTVYATFNTVTSTNDPLVTVRNPTFSDNFSVAHNYLTGGAGSWDGVYAYPTTTIPGSGYVNPTSPDVLLADANTTSNGVLTVESEDVGWEFNQNDGFFLFKYVPGDFQTAVHISALLTTNGTVIAAYNYPGLLARAYSVTNSTIGGPGGPTNGEDWVSWARFDEFGIGTRAEMTINNGTTRPATSDVGSDQRWLLMTRVNGTGFKFYQRSSASDPWQPSPAGQAFDIPQFAGIPMQVGIMEGGFNSGNLVTANFDHFMLDSTTSGLQLQAVNLGNGTVMLSWPADPNAQLQSTGSLNPPNWQPVAGTPILGANGYTITVTTGPGAQFFRLKN